jgi:hypothetical protein
MQLLIDDKYRTIYFKQDLVFYKTTKGNIDASHYFKKTGELKKTYTNLLKSDKTVPIIKKKVDKKHILGLTNKSLKGGAFKEIKPVTFNLFEKIKIPAVVNDKNDKNDKKQILDAYIAILVIAFTYLNAKMMNVDLKTEDENKMDLILDFIIATLPHVKIIKLGKEEEAINFNKYPENKQDIIELLKNISILHFNLITYENKIKYIKLHSLIIAFFEQLKTADTEK